MRCKQRLRHDRDIYGANREIKHTKGSIPYSKTVKISVQNQKKTLRQQLGNVNTFQCFMSRMCRKNSTGFVQTEH